MAYVQGRRYWRSREEYRKLHYPTEAEKLEKELKELEEKRYEDSHEANMPESGGF